MNTYEVKVRFTEVVTGKAWVTVEAESKEEALQKLESNEFIDIDCSADSSDSFDLDLSAPEFTEE